MSVICGSRFPWSFNDLFQDLQPDMDPAARECVAERVLSGHEYAVNALAWSPDDKFLLTSAEQVIKMWEVAVSLALEPIFSQQIGLLSDLSISSASLTFFSLI